MKFFKKIFKSKKKKQTDHEDNVLTDRNKEVEKKIEKNFGKAIKELSKR